MSTPVIDVREQRALGLARTFVLCLKGIKHRLFRSFLTFAVIVLAVAFFMYLLGSSIDARAVHHGVRAETVVVRRAAQALELWLGRPTPTVMGHRLADADAVVLARISAVAHQPRERIATIATAVHDEERLLAFLDGLDAGTRVVLVKKANGRAVLDWLADSANWESFTRALGQMKAIRSPLPLARIQEVVAARRATAAEIVAITTAWNATIDQQRQAIAALVGSDLPARWQDWFAGADANGLAALATILASHGFADDFPVATITLIQADVLALRQRDRVAAELGDAAGRSAWKMAFVANPTLDEKLLLLDDERAVGVLGGRYARDELASISRAVAHERRLVRLERALAGKVPADDSLIGGRQLFLVLISFLVCGVGIANAMLMAITERFREIATMKCLGATDGFILTQFLMEAAMQGVAGGVLGMVIGLLLAMIADGVVYGGHLLTYFPTLGLLACAGLCVLAGLVLATLASIYPSWMASRMAPMDAMRVE